MLRFGLILMVILGGGVIAAAQNINFEPKSLEKDCKKLWEVDDIELSEVQVPDSLYHDILLEKGKIFATSSSDQLLGYAYVGRIYSCRAGGCGVDQAANVASFDQDYEYFDYFIIFNTDLRVEKIRVYNYQATHGHEVGGKGWLKQFIGYSGEGKLEYGKNIDSISGATISANAITYNVQESCRFLKLLEPVLENQKTSFKVMIAN